MIIWLWIRVSGHPSIIAKAIHIKNLQLMVINTNNERLSTKYNEDSAVHLYGILTWRPPVRPIVSQSQVFQTHSPKGKDSEINKKVCVRERYTQERHTHTHSEYQQFSPIVIQYFRLTRIESESELKYHLFQKNLTQNLYF